MGEPSVRIALLEHNLYDQVQRYSVNGVAKIRDKELAKKVQLQSVSVAERRIRFIKSNLLSIKGDMLLAGVRVFPAQNGCCEFPGGRICFDPKLGLVIEEEK